jgi:hypothetical protein
VSDPIELPTGYGQVAYDAYATDCDWRSIHGEPLPAWADQRPEIRKHWDAAAEAVIQYVKRVPG